MEADKLKEILGIEGDEQNEKIEAAIAAINEETAGLVTTKDKLRQQVKDLDKRLKSYKDIDLEEIEEMKTELVTLREAAEAAAKGGDGKLTAEEQKELNQLRRDNKKLAEENASERKAREDVTGKYHGSLKERALRAAIKKVNVKPEAEDIIYQAFANVATVEDVDGETVIQLKNKDGLNLPPEEYFTDWAKTDAAKEFIKPPDNSGGNARGGSGTGSGKTMRLTEFNQLSPAEQMAFMTEKHGQVID
jgi:hypothetical protein